jgi:hypothetical protein
LLIILHKVGIYLFDQAEILFEERREKISKNMIVNFNSKKENLKILISCDRLQIITTPDLEKLLNFSRSVVERILAKGQSSFKFIIAYQIKQKLSFFLEKEAVLLAQMQNAINRNFEFFTMTIVSESKDYELAFYKKMVYFISLNKCN